MEMIQKTGFIQEPQDDIPSFFKKVEQTLLIGLEKNALSVLVDNCD